MEEWKDIKGYEGLYRVSDRGTVESVDHYARNNVNGGKRLVKGRQIAVHKMPNGYTQVTLSNGDNHVRVGNNGEKMNEKAISQSEV